MSENIGNKNLFSIYDEGEIENGFAKLDDIKKLKGKSIVIYYDKNKGMVAQPYKDFEKKTDKEKVEIIENSKNIHVEYERFAASTFTRNKLHYFIKESDLPSPNSSGTEEKQAPFIIIPTIKALQKAIFGLNNPGDTSAEKGEKTANRIEDLIEIYKNETGKKFEKEIIVSGNSIGNYAATKTINNLNNYAKKKGDILHIRARYNQLARGGQVGINIDESKTDGENIVPITKETYESESVNDIVYFNSAFDEKQEKGLIKTDYHRKDAYVDSVKSTCKNIWPEGTFDEEEFKDMNGALTIFKINGRTFGKPLNFKINNDLDIGDFKGTKYEEAILRSETSENGIEVEAKDFPEEFKTKLCNFDDSSKIILRKKADSNDITFKGIDEDGKKLSGSFSLINNNFEININNKFEKPDLEAEATKTIKIPRTIKTECKNNSYSHNIKLNEYSKRTLVMKKMLISEKNNEMEFKIDPGTGIYDKIFKLKKEGDEIKIIEISTDENGKETETKMELKNMKEKLKFINDNFIDNKSLENLIKNEENKELFTNLTEKVNQEKEESSEKNKELLTNLTGKVNQEKEESSEKNKELLTNLTGKVNQEKEESSENLIKNEENKKLFTNLTEKINQEKEESSEKNKELLTNLTGKVNQEKEFNTEEFLLNLKNNEESKKKLENIYYKIKRKKPEPKKNVENFLKKEFNVLPEDIMKIKESDLNKIDNRVIKLSIKKIQYAINSKEACKTM